MTSCYLLALGMTPDRVGHRESASEVYVSGYCRARDSTQVGPVQHVETRNIKDSRANRRPSAYRVVSALENWIFDFLVQTPITYVFTGVTKDRVLHHLEKQPAVGRDLGIETS